MFSSFEYGNRGYRTLAVVSLAALAPLLGTLDAAAAPSCPQYPIPWQPAEGARTAAQADLTRLSPGASLTWNAATGTLASTTQLSVPLPACTDGQDAIAQVNNVLGAHPALFQLDLDEWRRPGPYDCKLVNDPVTFSIGRARLAGHPDLQDLIGFALQRIDGVVQLTGVYGTYLPVAGTSTSDAMAACSTLTIAAATTTARSTPLHAATFSQCRPTGALQYTLADNDSLRFADEDEWGWENDGGQVALTGQRTLQIVVNPANYTPELLSSNARCPVDGGAGDQFTIGFEITFDVHTGAVVNIKPGLGCFVC